MAGRPTIKDVAAKAGCSIATVSMVMNKKEVSIPKSTRDKVLAAAKSINYRPNSLAVSLISKRTKVLGLIIPDNRNLYCSTLSRAIEEVAHQVGYSLIFGNTNHMPNRDMEYLQAFTDRQVDGIIFVVSPAGNEQNMQELVHFIESSPVPIVAVDRTVSASSLFTVQMNHEKAGYLATKYLLELGHRRIGTCASPGILTCSMERTQGYRKALEKFGIPYDEALRFVEAPFQLADDTAMFERILAQRVTGVLMVNDSAALAFYRFAREKGIRIPQDISVVGSDDEFFADVLTPPLTTIRQPVQEIGENAVRVLLQHVEYGTNPPSLVHQYEPQLIVRGSTCPPAAV